MLFGNPETTSGGNALKFYASMRLDIRAKDKIMETGKAEPIGNHVKVKVVKNKVRGLGCSMLRANSYLVAAWHQAGAALLAVPLDFACLLRVTSGVAAL